MTLLTSPMFLLMSHSMAEVELVSRDLRANVVQLVPRDQRVIQDQRATMEIVDLVVPRVFLVLQDSEVSKDPPGLLEKTEKMV